MIPSEYETQLHHRILLVERSRLAAEALIFALDSDPTLDAVGYALGPCEALELATSLSPDSVLVGELPSQPEVVQTIHARFPRMRLIVLRERLVPIEVNELYAAGAAEVLETSCSADELLHAIAAARRRQLVFERGERRRLAGLRLVHRGAQSA